MEIAELPYENIDEWYFMVFGDTIVFVSSPNKPFPDEIIKIMETKKKVIFKRTGVKIKQNIIGMRSNFSAITIPNSSNPLNTKINFNSFNQNPIQIPNNIEKISFSNHFNHPLYEEFIDDGIHKLQSFLPRNIKEIFFDNNFNQPVDYLPEGIVKLRFGLCFDQTLDNLPSSLEVLKLSGKFNRSLENLPGNLRKLNFRSEKVNIFNSEYFNQPLDFLPQSLRILKLGKKFSHPLNNLPPNIEKIYLRKTYTLPLTHIPSNTQIIFDQ